MLTRLIINDYALISHLDTEFHSGFSVITGETGAGKSIILGAIGLLLGARADSHSIKVGARQCRIEAHFDLSAYPPYDFFSEADIDFDGSECIISRIVTSAGKSRAFINDTPVTVAELKRLAQSLVDVHSQHQNLLLQTSDFQLSVIDALAGNADLLSNIAACFVKVQNTQKELQSLYDERNRAESEREFIEFQLSQLLEANLQADELENLQSEIEILENAEELQSLYSQSAAILSDDEHGICNNLRAALKNIQEAASLSSEATILSERINNSYIELRELSSDIERLAFSIQADPQRLSQLNLRLDTINSLMHKHHVDSIEALIEIRDSFDTRLQSFDSNGAAIEKLQQELDVLRNDYMTLAARLTESRSGVVNRLTSHIHSTLESLGMPNATMQVVFSTRKDFTAKGLDDINFTISTNKSSPYQTLDTLSGGEAARVMLALKDLLTGVVHLPTIIFDEIDTGVSGRIAESMGAIMHRMAMGNRQIISITHLPQIAARGSNHYRVYKKDGDDTTNTHIEQLDEEQRVLEIAAMLSGDNISDAAIDNARALLIQ